MPACVFAQGSTNVRAGSDWLPAAAARPGAGQGCASPGIFSLLCPLQYECAARCEPGPAEMCLTTSVRASSAGRAVFCQHLHACGAGHAHEAGAELPPHGRRRGLYSSISTKLRQLPQHQPVARVHAAHTGEQARVALQQGKGKPDSPKACNQCTQSPPLPESALNCPQAAATGEEGPAAHGAGGAA